MKTLADFKRAMIIGSRWKGFNHMYNKPIETREVSHVRTSDFAFNHPREDGTFVSSWASFPTARNIEFLADGTANIYAESNYNIGSERIHERKLILSYKQV